MPDQLPPLDYEGVSRSKGAKSWADDPNAADRKKANWNESNDPGFTKRSAQVLVGEASFGGRRKPSLELGQAVNGVATQRKRAASKRGHAITFAGLFLFTLIVFLRPYEFFPSLAWASSSALIVALLTLLAYVPTQLGLEGTLTIRPREINLVLLLTVLVVLSIPLALEPLRAWNGLLDYLKVVLMFIVMVNAVRTEARLRLLFWLVLFASCLLSISALSDFFLGKLALRGERIAGAVGGMFENPNDLALHLVTMLPIAVALSIGSKNPLKKIMYGLAALTSIAGVVVTFSRGGFVGMACVGLVLAWRIPRNNKLAIALILPLLFVGTMMLATGRLGGRSVTSSEDSTLARQDDLKRSLYIASRHPIIGVGLDNYVLYSNSNHATHNAYTQVASEIGLPALIVYLMFLFTPLKHLRRIGRETAAKRKTNQFYYLAVGLEASLVGFMVSSFFASVAYLWYVYYIVAYAICLRRLYDEDGQIETDDDGQEKAGY